jgi:hypothetical protein
VIYCIGSDYDGFGKDIKRLKGDKVKIRQEEEIELYAGMIAPIVIYDRFLYLQGKRK